ncbi:MAG TPA: TIR domain-containing protein [Desulfuromonadaceae bacterium]
MSTTLLPGFRASKRRIFVSYHHHGDSAYYDEFARLSAATCVVIQDNSVEYEVESDNADYVIRAIRECYITGSSCTVVLCGAQTPWRKLVDWEIKATLDKQHGLIGINLPTNPLTAQGKYTVPDRLHDNIESGYAAWLQWADLATGPNVLTQIIQAATAKSVALIKNSRPLLTRNE